MSLSKEFKKGKKVTKKDDRAFDRLETLCKAENRYEHIEAVARKVGLVSTIASIALSVSAIIFKNKRKPLVLAAVGSFIATKVSKDVVVYAIDKDKKIADEVSSMMYDIINE